VTGLLALRLASSARAHGEPPEALSLVARDRDEARLVRLNEGLALRTAEGFRYLCPALWGEDAVVPAHAIPGGSAVIGAGSGLLLVSAEGAVERHPDPSAAGRVLALAASADGLFALRESGDLHQVLRVHEDRVQVLFGGTQLWDDLAASDQGLQLVRLSGGRLLELRLSLSGDTIAEDGAPVPEGSAAALARLVGDVGYAVLLTSSLTAELGRIEQGRWRLIQAGQAVGGPVVTAAGDGYVAVDGELARFDEQRPLPLGEGAVVRCLRRHFELAYACSDRGLRELAADGLGASLFELDELGPPDLAQLPEDRREACTLQWQRYVIDLRAVGITPRGLGGPDAGASDAGPRPDPADAGKPPRWRADDGGCSAVAARGSDAYGTVAIAALAFLLRARRRRHE
jgi:hypothetical protein